MYSSSLQSPTLLGLVACLTLAGCGGSSSSSGNGNGTGTTVDPDQADGLEFVEEHDASNASELRQALVEAESLSATTAQGLSTNDEDHPAVLIRIQGDIGPQTFEDEGQLFYEGDTTIYLLGDPENHVTLDAGGHSRIIEIDNNSVGFYVEGLRFTGGDTASGGGAIYDDIGPVLVYDSIFEDNHAGEGGAISGRIFEVVDSEFSENTVDGGSFNNGGGAIHSMGIYTAFNVYLWEGAEYGISVRGSDFTNNSSSQRNGGAISHESDPYEIINSDFTGNTAENPTQSHMSGGALAVPGDGEIQESSFVDNSTSSNGGAIIIGVDDDGDVAIHDSHFEANEAIANNTTAYGGAVYSDGMDGTESVDASMLDLRDSSFIGNKAEQTQGNEFGGAAAVTGDSGDIELTNVETEGNEPADPVFYSEGGGVLK